MIELTIEDAIRILSIAEKFIKKVDNKQARSVETYEDMKTIQVMLKQKIEKWNRDHLMKG